MSTADATADPPAQQGTDAEPGHRAAAWQRAAGNGIATHTPLCLILEEEEDVCIQFPFRHHGRNAPN